MKLQKVKYEELTAKQKEIFNFQKVAAQLADYGFNCIKLDDDWRGPISWRTRKMETRLSRFNSRVVSAFTGSIRARICGCAFLSAKAGT